MKYKNYTDTDIINNAKEVYSIAGLLKSLRLQPIGGNYYTAKRRLKELNVNTDHWKGQGWNGGERLKDWSKYVRNKQLKKHLIKERKYKCERCKRVNWMKKPLPLEVHHVDKDRTNNAETNLQLLCSNCHSQVH